KFDLLSSVLSLAPSSAPSLMSSSVPSSELDTEKTPGPNLRFGRAMTEKGSRRLIVSGVFEEEAIVRDLSRRLFRCRFSQIGVYGIGGATHTLGGEDHREAAPAPADADAFVIERAPVNIERIFLL